MNEIIQVNLLMAAQAATSGGPQWSHESTDLDATLLSWGARHRIAEHRNSEVDVILIGVEGEGIVTIDGEPHPVSAGVALLIPKGSSRALESTSERWSYLSVHQRRRGLMPTFSERKPGN